MFCTTECWDCEDRNCKHYISKTELYFENQRLEENWNELKQWLNEVKTMYKECNDDIAEAHFGSVLDKIKYLEKEE